MINYLKKYFKTFFLVLLLIISSLYFVYYLSFVTGSKEGSDSLVVSNPKRKEVVREKKDSFKPGDLTLESIFSENPDYKGADFIKLVATGDYGVVREVNYKTINYNNFNWAVEEFIPLLSNADITLINLEGTLLNECPIYRSGFTFCGDDKHVEGMNSAGVDVVNLANNHAGNFGIAGFNETEEILSREGMLVSGSHEENIVYKNVKGLKFAFLGYNDVGVQAGAASADLERIKREVKIASTNAAVVIVSMHWGVEYTTNITDRQKNLAYTAIDAGADLIVGNHPHWIQPIEIYKNKLITYAHGNFIFDQMWSEETREGVVGEYTFYKDGTLVDANFYPVYIVDYGKATIPNKSRNERILNRLEGVSRKVRR